MEAIYLCVQFNDLDIRPKKLINMFLRCFFQKMVKEGGFVFLFFIKMLIKTMYPSNFQKNLSFSINRSTNKRMGLKVKLAVPEKHIINFFPCIYFSVMCNNQFLVNLDYRLFS